MCCAGLKNLCSQITVEPILFLFSLSHGLYMIIAQTLYIEKVCNVNLNFTREICDNIYVHPDEQIAVQKYVSELQAYNGIIQAIPSIIYALFAGPWSDRYGRRTLIAMACFGYIFNNGVFIINAYWFYELKAEYLLFECLQDCTGGSVCFFLGCYAYISDVSTRKNRTKRLAFLDGLFPIGFFTGMSISGLIKKQWGFIPNFFLGMLAALLAVLYTVFVLKDSQDNRPEEVKAMLKEREAASTTTEPARKRNVCAQLFDLENLKASFRTTFKKRDNGMGSALTLLIFTFVVEIFMTHGRGATMFLYFRKEFAWTETQFGQFMALFGVVGLFTQYVAVPFLTDTCKIHDTLLGLGGVVGSGINLLIMALVRHDEWLYLGCVVAFLGPTITTSCRSLVTKCVGPFEVGAVFSIMGAIQATVPLAAFPFFGFIYKATVDTFPGMFLIISACFYVVVAVMLIISYFCLRRVDRAEKDQAEVVDEDCLEWNRRMSIMIEDKEKLDII